MSISWEESKGNLEKALTAHVKHIMMRRNIKMDDEEFEEMMEKIERMTSDAIDECMDGGGYND